MTIKVERYMTKNPYSVECTATLNEAVETMKDCGIRHLPVLDDGFLCGLLSDRDLREAHALPESEKLRVSDVMKREVYAVSCDRDLKDVVVEMADRRIGSAVILDRRGDVSGIFTTIDALNLLSAFLDQDEESLGVEDQDDWADGNLSF